MTILTYKNRLLQSALMGYISPAPHKTGAGIRTPLDTKAHNRASGFFSCDASPHLFRIMAGRMGPLSGGPVSFVPGSTNPVRLATLSFVPLDGEFLYQSKGFTSWKTANHAVPALTSSASIPGPKSIIACPVQRRWHGAYGLNPSAITALWWRCAFHPFSVIWLTIYATFTTCLTAKSTARNTPENLTQKQHSASWWSVCLHDIQEAL